jgi:hypothetical protein
MVKKKIDPRVRTLIENGVGSHHRSLFVLVSLVLRCDSVHNLPCLGRRCVTHTNSWALGVLACGATCLPMAEAVQLHRLPC